MIPPHDPLLVELAGYAREYRVDSLRALDAARACLADALAGALTALAHDDCRRLLGPVVPGATMIGGARVPGTSFELDPVKAAFDIGTMIGWPASAADDERAASVASLGGLLATTDWASRRRVLEGRAPLLVRELLAAIAKALEIHAALASGHAHTARRVAPATWTRIATTAVVTALLDGTREQVAGALANAFADGAAMDPGEPRTAGRARWLGGDATARGVRLALLALAGETGPPDALTAPDRGFEATVLGGPLTLERTLGTYALDGWRPRLAPGLDAAVTAHYAPKQARAILALYADSARLDALPVPTLLSTLARP